MAIIKCKMCGGDLNLVEGASTAECEYCGSVQTVPVADNEKKLTLFARANRLRAACEFDKAAGIYETIVADFPEEAEAYWGLVLCKYGIEYVDDPATGKKIPTCHRSSFDSIMEDSDFEQALENADAVARRVYREEAKQIEEIRKGIIAVSANETPYDIFICYKETDEKGERTLDSVLVQDIYDALIAKDYRVFFARITLEDKLGMEYEPYIFAALNSAKIMLAVGTDYEYYNAVWVKNEWSRYLKLMAKDKDKHLIPCYKGIDAYDMPKEFAKLQAQDLGKVGAMQDLLRGIEKIVPKMQKSTTIIQTSTNASAMVMRGQFALEDGDFDKANEYFDRALDQNPQDGGAYLGKVLAALHLSSPQQLDDYLVRIHDDKDFDRAIRFSDPTTSQMLIAIRDRAHKKYLVKCLTEGLKKIQTQIEEQMRRKERDYQNACMEMFKAKTERDFGKAALSFQQLRDYKQSKEKYAECIQFAKKAHAAVENEQKAKMELARAQTDFSAMIEKACKGTPEQFEKALIFFQTHRNYEPCAKAEAICNTRKRLLSGNTQDTTSGLQKKISELDNRIDECNGKLKKLGLFGKRNQKEELKAKILDLQDERCEYQIQLDNAEQKKYKREKDIQSLNDDLLLIDTILTLQKAKVGQTVTLGRYYYADRVRMDRINWIVMKKSDDWKGVYVDLLSENILDIVQFGSAKYQTLKWENSNLYRWLKGEFFNTAFSDSEKKYIVEVTEPAKNDLEWGKKYRAKVTPYARSRGVTANSSGDGNWFLKSDCSPNYCPDYVTDSGTALGGYSMQGVIIYNQREGARPMLRLNLKNLY